MITSDGSLECIMFVQCAVYNALWRNSALQTMLWQMIKISSLKTLGHGIVIKSHRKLRMWLLIHALILVNPSKSLVNDVTRFMNKILHQIWKINDFVSRVSRRSIVRNIQLGAYSASTPPLKADFWHPNSHAENWDEVAHPVCNVTEQLTKAEKYVAGNTNCKLTTTALWNVAWYICRKWWCVIDQGVSKIFQQYFTTSLIFLLWHGCTGNKFRKVQ